MPRSLPFSKFSSTCQSFTNGFDHLWQGGSLWGKDKVVRFFGGIVHAATNEQPMLSIILPLVQHRDDGPVEEPGTRAFLHSLNCVANLHREGRTLRPMLPLGVSVRSVSGIRPVHCKPQPSRPDTHALPARYAGPDFHHSPYLPRP